MRMMKLALITGIAVLIGTGSASAITVKKRIEAPGLPPEVWADRRRLLRDREMASGGRQMRGDQRG